jgi:ethanolamine utilization protein EutA
MDVYGVANPDRDDLGPELGAAIRDEVDRRNLPVVELPAGIRATVLGSTQHSVQISGNTITLTDEDVLPLRNVPIVPFAVDDDATVPQLTDVVLEKLRRYDVKRFDDGVAFGFHLHGVPTFEYLETVVDATIAGWKTVDAERPLVMVFDSDIALNAGDLAAQRVDVPTIAVDLYQFGYLDVGEPLESTGAVPITVKSLVFEG